MFSYLAPAAPTTGAFLCEARGGRGRQLRYRVLTGPSQELERDGFRLNRHHALDLWWSMIFSENRYPLFRIML